MKRIAILSAVLLLPLLTACLEFDEVSELKPDGSVDFALNIQMPDIPDKKQDEGKQKERTQEIEAVFQSLGGSVQLKGKEEKTEYGKTTFVLRAAMDSLEGVGRVYHGLGAAKKDSDKKEGREVFEQLFSQKNEYAVKKTKQGTLLITREFSPPKMPKKKGDKKEKDQEELSKNMEEMMLNAMTFQFELFVPTEVIRSNATQRFGNNLRWSASLGYLSKQPFKMEVEIASTPELEAKLLKK